MPVRRYGDATEAVNQLHFDPRLLGQRQQKIVGPVEKLAQVGGGEFGLGRVVQVQHVVDGRRKRAEARLHVFDPGVAFAFQIRLGQESGEEFEAAQRVADFMRQQRRHFDQGLLPPEMLAVLFEFFRLTHVAQDKDGSGMSRTLTLLQPGVADGNPDGMGRIRRGWIRRTRVQPGEGQFRFFARLASPVERRPERGGQRVGRFEAAPEQPRRFRVESRNPSSRFDYQNAARQAFQNAPLAFADAAVFFDTGRQVAVRDFEFLAEMSHLPLQLPISAFERTRRLGE